MDEFLKETRGNLSRSSRMSKLAEDYIIKNNMIEDKFGKSKVIAHDDLDDDLEDSFDAESKAPSDIVPGSVYIFIYSPKTLTTIKDAFNSFTFADKMPILLCTEKTETLIKGINLNFCSMAVRTCILNEVVNLDPKFFDKKVPYAAKKVMNNKNSISFKLGTIFGSEKYKNDFYRYLDAKYKLDRNDIIYRSYEISKIKKLRLIETWCWCYIPFLQYKGTLKEFQIKLIQKMNSLKKKI